MKYEKLKKYLFTFIIIFLYVIIPYTLCKYSTTINKKITVSAVQPEYDVLFNPNVPPGATVTGLMANQHFVYGTAQNLRSNGFSVTGYSFSGWNTSADGSGIAYQDLESVNKLTDIDGGQVNLYAQWSDVVAEINGTFYHTIQDAVAAVPKNNTETTIKLLCNVTTDAINTSNNQNIVLNLQNYSIVSDGTSRLIDNKGRLKIYNGTIRTSAAYAAIDNETSGTLIITDANIIATGERGAIYNNKGVLEISGNTYMSSTTSQRATIQNLAGGRLTITGGTFVSTDQQAINNLGTMTIGVKDGNVDTTTPTFQGATYGITSTANFNFYNGTVKGLIQAFDDETKIVDTETGYSVVHGVETIGNETYITGYLAVPVTVTFDGNGGTPSESTRSVEIGHAIGILPTAIQTGFELVGWFTETQGGTQIDENTVINGNITYHAQWAPVKVAQLNGVDYESLQNAIDAVAANNTSTTITLLRDTSENVTIAANKKIVFDFQNYTIQNATNYSVITNYGDVTISNGTIRTNSQNASAINNNGGTLLVNGGSIIATGDRQAVYNDGGNVTISGTAYLIANASQRGTVQNLVGSTLTITGGTIISNKQQAVNNLATMTIGIADGTVDATTPILQGATYGITSTTGFNLYDGIMKGKTAAVDVEGNITNIESGYTIDHGTETINNNSYYTLYLS